MNSSLRHFVSRAAVSAWLAIDSMRSQAQQYILILAHMRSGSSLLFHLLASNPEIAGCGERNATYTTDRDLARLALQSNRANGSLWRSSTHVVDQLNHSHLIENAGLLSRPSVRCIFLLREPGAAISSMTDVLGRHYGLNLDAACDYYRQRLADLANYAGRADDRLRAFVLTYDDLVDRGAATLASLSRFLNLDSPLSENYNVFAFTGKRGDPSETISAGRIVSNRRAIDPGIAPALLADLERHYDDTLARLMARCRTVDGG